jgi:hypothetical protein
VLQTKVVEKIKTGIIFSKLLFEIRAIYNVKKRKETVDPDRPQMTVQYGTCACMLGK